MRDGPMNPRRERPMPSNSPGPSRLLSRLEQTPDGTIGHLADYRLFSHFQPIYSFSHRRLVGHEALLRARLSNGQGVPPLDVFANCPDDHAMATCDRLSRLVHLSNYAAQKRQAEWLFLNIHPNVFHRLAEGDGQGYLRNICDHFGITGKSLVLEILESASTDPQRVVESMAIARSMDMLIALDDFGAGHSNFDRVWKMQPDIVKLDRSLVARAARDRQAQRIMSQMVSLLHECGAMVLAEGVETRDEALVALDCDADMVQGYFFGRPQVDLVLPRHVPAPMLDLTLELHGLRTRKGKQHRELVAPLINAVGYAGALLSAGRSMEEASRSIMALPNAEICYVLDAQGYQIGPNLWSPRNQADAPRMFEPLRDTDAACWSQRPYFRRAVHAPNRVQITRPYRTVHGQHACVTASMAFHCQVDGERQLRVICGDMRWAEPDAAIADPSA